MNSTISRFSITAEDLQFSHDVSQEKRDASGKWTTGGTESYHRPDIGDDEQVDIYAPSTGEVFDTSTHAAIKKMIEEERLLNGESGLQDLAVERAGIIKPVQKKDKTAETKPVQKPLPPPSDYSKFKTGKPVTAVVYRGKSSGGSGKNGGGMAALGHGKYYGIEPHVAERFSEYGTVDHDIVTLKNPVVIHSDEDMKEVKQYVEKETGVDMGKKGNLYAGYLFGEQPEIFTSALKKLGYDGLITTYKEAPGGQQLLVFPGDNTQLSQFSQGEHDYSSTQFNLDEGGYSRTQGSPMRQIRAMAKEIDDDDLDEKGREDEPHITIKYGLHCERPDDFESIVSDFGSVEIILGKTAMFESKDSDGRDVVYLEVFGDDIHRLNKLICESTECTDTFPTYIPHVCLAYVQAGKGWKYTGDDRVEGKRLFFTDFVFSSKNGDRKSIPLVSDVDVKLKPSDVQYVTFDQLRDMKRFSITADDLVDMGQLTFTWDEKKHPRGHEGNPGQFAKVGSGKNQSGKQTRLFGGVKPIEKTPEKTSTLTPEMSGILGKLDVILADKHPSRGRMNPEQLTRNALNGVSSTFIGDMAEHPEVSEKQKEALHKEMDRRFTEFIDRVNANTQNTIEEQSKAKRIKENEEIKKSGQRPVSPKKTISEASGHSPTVRHAEATLGEIAKLHSALPGTKPIPVKTTTGTKTAGKFAFYASLGEAIDISVSSKSPHPRMTFAHEYGHFMDFTIGRMDTSGRNVVFASMKDAAEYKGENHPIGKLMTLIRNSKATGMLRDHIRGSSTVKKTVNHPKLGPTEVTMMVDKGYLRYLLSPDEQFARAYAQYVATKSGDDTMRKELKYCQSKEVSDQWSDEDFEPIAKAFDEYFEALGLKGEQE